jgi:hypothetical protein
MRNAKFVVIMLSVFFIIGCEKDDIGSNNLDINFKLHYDGAPLVFLTDVAYPDGRTMSFNRFSFFVSEVTLSSGELKSVSEDTKMINFNTANSSLQNALKGEKVNFTGFKEGDYSQIQICIGVDEKNNGKEPSDFASTHPLSNQSEYWAAWNSYIFFRAEGFLDANRDGTKNLGFALHTGSDNAYRCINLPINLTVDGGEDNIINLVIDAKKIFGKNTIFDIDQNPQLHSLTQLPQVIELSNNIKDAFVIE